MTDQTVDSDDSTDTTNRREQGVDLGALADELRSHPYPATAEELVAAYGDCEIASSGETRTFRTILERLEGGRVAFDSAEQVRQMVYNLVGSGAVGREGYSDRGGVVGDDDRGQTTDSQSF